MKQHKIEQLREVEAKRLQIQNEKDRNINDKEWNDLFLEFELDNSLDEFNNSIQQLEKE